MELHVSGNSRHSVRSRRRRWVALSAAAAAAVLAAGSATVLPAISNASTTPSAQVLHETGGAAGAEDDSGKDSSGVDESAEDGAAAQDKGKDQAGKGKGAEKGKKKGQDKADKKGKGAQGKGQGAENGTLKGRENEKRVGNPGTETKKIKYGPYKIPASVDDVDGRTKNTIERGVETPCKDCMITRINPSLVYANGDTANVDTGPGLHHFVMLNKEATDATCGGSFPNPSMFLGERFAAAGNERTVISYPKGYGYPASADVQWTMISDLMNHAEEEKEVFIQVEYDFVPKAEAAELEPVRPVWMDIASCSDILDTYKIEKGASTKSTEWEVNVPGKVVTMGGHLHNDGVTLTATNEDTGEVLCESKATYGDTKGSTNIHGEKELGTMSACVGDPLGVVKKGQKIKLTSTYDATIPRDDVMGIMVTYIDEE